MSLKTHIAESLAITLLVGAAVALLAWPLPIDPAGHWLGASGNDHSSIAWTWQFVADRLAAGQLPWGHTDAIEAPVGATLFPADLPGGLMLAPIIWLFGPVVAVNLAGLSHHALAAGLTWLWLRREGMERSGAAAGSLAFALAPAMVTSTFNGNPDVSVSIYIPMVLLALTARERWAGLAAGLVVAMAGFANPYIGVMALLAASAVLIGRRRWSDLAITASLSAVGALAVAGLTTWALHAPDAAVLKGPRMGTFGTASLLSLVWPQPLVQRTDPHWELPHVAVGAYLGLSMLLALLGRRERRWAWALVALGVIMALGPVLRLYDVPLPPPGEPLPTGWDGNLHVPLPWAAVDRLPGLGQLHLNARFTLLSMVGLVWLMADGVPRLGRWAWAAPALVVFDLGVLAGAPAMLASTPVYDDGACALLEGLDEGMVIDLPPTYHELWLFDGICHGRPVAEGINRPIPREVQHYMMLAGPGRDLEFLASLDYRWLVHHHGLPSEHFVGISEGLGECVVAENDRVRVVDLWCLR